MKALLVIPAFNEAATIKDLVTAAKAHIPNVLVIDDGPSLPRRMPPGM